MHERCTTLSTLSLGKQGNWTGIGGWWGKEEHVQVTGWARLNVD